MTRRLTMRMMKVSKMVTDFKFRSCLPIPYYILSVYNIY